MFNINNNPMNNNVNLVEIFYLADEFCKEFELIMRGRHVEKESGLNLQN